MNYKVLCVCFTYNQSKYIENTLHGFSMQETEFPFVCLVIDDASTDNEQNKIREWMDSYCDMDNAEFSDIPESHIITVKHKENNNCYFAFYLLTKNLYGNAKKGEFIELWRRKCKYVAPCEGDDLWTNPQKLQMQVKALDNNPQCTICIGQTKTIHPNGTYTGGQIPNKPQNLGSEFTLQDYCREQFEVGQWTGHTSTFFYRSDIAKYYDKSMIKAFRKFPYGDICIILCCLLQGNGIYIDEYMSNYRILSGGFNSEIKANSDKAIEVEKKLIAGITDFDTFTDYKYHKYITKRILRSECIIEFWEGNRNGFVFLKPKYLSIARMQGWRSTLLIILQTIFPNLYPMLKNLIKAS